MTGRGIDQVMPQPLPPLLYERCVQDARDYVRLAEQVNGAIAAPVSPHYIWGDALAEIERVMPQLRIVNLETAVTRSDTSQPHKGIHYRMDPSHVSCLTAARIDACALANNHVLDWGPQGLRETLEPHGSRRSDLGCPYFAAIERGTGLLQRLEIVPMRLQRFRLVRAQPAEREHLACLFNAGRAPLGRVEPCAGGWLLCWT